MRLKISMMSGAAALALLAGGAWADEAAIAKWLPEFQPSTLDEAAQRAELEWFMNVA